MNAMREALQGAPGELERLLGDRASVEAAAARVGDRSLVLVGTGTSFHAANHGAFLLALAGRQARAVQGIDASLHGCGPREGEALVLLSHRGTKRFTSDVLARAVGEGVPTVLITRLGGDDGTIATVETVQEERSAAFTVSHLAALLRLAQLGQALGAPLPELGAVPEAVSTAVSGARERVRPPQRLLEFIGSGTNAWTAAEGSLKTRETCYLATEGLGVEQFLHGPGVALGAGDELVVLDGGGPASDRAAEAAAIAEGAGARTHVFSERDLGEPLSIFPLTATVDRIALELAEEMGCDPDTFGRDRPTHSEAWGRVRL